jgi:holo-[acyl-carrier protein] synthase
MLAGSCSLLVGIDLVSVTNIAESLHRFGSRFLSRVFTQTELSYCLSSADAPRRLAARFAAKEAARKVLRIGDEAVPWRAIEVERSPSGAVQLLLHGEAQVLAERAGLVGFALSLTHEGDFASAVVIGEKRQE